MSVKEVTNLRKEGRLDKALALAKRELNEDANEWTRMSLFWVFRDYVKKSVFHMAKQKKPRKQ